MLTTRFEVEWTSNSAEQAVKGPKHHQAVSGYWHTQAAPPLGRIRSYLDSTATRGLTTLDANSEPWQADSWLPTMPVAAWQPRVSTP